ncbi:MAG: MarR family winged helix-turn-helix transcriptional regulator [Gemmatimonadaceae bacterium]
MGDHGRGAGAVSAAPPARVADRLHSAAIHLLRWLRREDARSGLSAPRLSALSVLVFGGARITLGDLAAAEQVSAPTMTRLVDALEAEGLVARAADPADGRVTLVRATPKGRRLLEAGRARRVAALAGALSELDAADRATLERAAALIERLAERARAADGR